MLYRVNTVDDQFLRRVAVDSNRTFFNIFYVVFTDLRIKVVELYPKYVTSLYQHYNH